MIDIKILSNREYEELKSRGDNWYKHYEECYNQLVKTQEWILEMLKIKGYRVENIPYMVETKEFVKHISNEPIYKQEEKITTIPELRIMQCRGFNLHAYDEVNK